MDNLTSPDTQPSEFANQQSAPLSVPLERNFALFNNRGLRAGWRLLIYILLFIFLDVILTFVAQTLTGLKPGVLEPPNMTLQDALGFIAAYASAAIMALGEKRDVGVYGLPAREAFRGKFWLGVLFGVLEISLLIGLIAVFGGYSFGSLAIRGSEIPRWALVHAFLFLCVGFAEEYLFRGYTQFTLADGMGFWPAAIVLSLLFGWAHRSNGGENWVGVASVVVVGLFFAFTLYRTGSLWYAVGLHASFDWGESFLYSVPDSGLILRGHLSNSIVHNGPNWLTGGTVGPEGSVFCFLTMGLQFLVVMWLFPKKSTATESAAPSALPHTS